MTTIKVFLKERTYPILIGYKILPQLGQKIKELRVGDDAIIITNPIIAQFYAKSIIESLKKNGITSKILTVPAGEQSKSIKQAFVLINKIAQYDVLKKSFIIALGGGVVGDLAGFVASIYKRGIPYIQIPTTLLAQIDSAIGGKVAIDLPSGKNLTGAFYQPKMVFSDLATLSTLSKRQMLNGLAEAVKYGIICDKKLFSFIEKNYKRFLALDRKALLYVIGACSRIKANIVSVDEKETKGLRTILNFGHTAGHAIEAAAKYNMYHHGEAVALGMRVACRISKELKMLSPKDEKCINQLLSDIGLPQKIKGISLNAILSKMKRDKKFLSKKNRFVLATSIGKVKVVEGIPQEMIQKSIKAYL
ncbi:MAG TPA: 3-dehydroquinate synthase [Candidatus Omnitrophota bacterium]|nr:3-dehydroquinate synthase [Candidatus Omnitrophota bacterium]